MLAEGRRVGKSRVTGTGWDLPRGSRAWWLPAWTLALDCLVQILASLHELICLRCLEQCLDREVYMRMFLLFWHFAVCEFPVRIVEILLVFKANSPLYPAGLCNPWERVISLDP